MFSKKQGKDIEMKKDEIHFLDWKRWLWGDAPPEFMIEVLIRTSIIYFFLLLAVRLMGKRMSGQITLTELAVMITLGAIISPAMQLPDRGIIFGILGLSAAVIFQRGLNLWAFKNEKVEKVTQGEMSLLVKDGLMIVEELEKTHVSRQQLYAMLRQKKINNLGKVKRAYLEGCGILTVYETGEIKAGLPIIPVIDPDIKALAMQVDAASHACCNCGHVQRFTDQTGECEKCKSTEWSKAYFSN